MQHPLGLYSQAIYKLNKEKKNLYCIAIQNFSIKVSLKYKMSKSGRRGKLQFILNNLRFTFLKIPQPKYSWRELTS